MCVKPNKIFHKKNMNSYNFCWFLCEFITIFFPTRIRPNDMIPTGSGSETLLYTVLFTLPLILIYCFFGVPGCTQTLVLLVLELLQELGPTSVPPHLVAIIFFISHTRRGGNIQTRVLYVYVTYISYGFISVCTSKYLEKSLYSKCIYNL